MMDADHGLTPELLRSLPGAGDNITQGMIDQAVESVRNLAGWHIWPVREETITVDTPGDPVVFLPTKRLVDVTAVAVDGREVDMDRVSWSEDGMLLLDRCAPRGFRRVEATIKHGYEIAPDIVGVASSMAVRAGNVGTSMSVGGISVGGASGLTPQSTEWRVVDMYKLGPMP